MEGPQAAIGDPETCKAEPSERGDGSQWTKRGESKGFREAAFDTQGRDGRSRGERLEVTDAGDKY